MVGHSLGLGVFEMAEVEGSSLELVGCGMVVVDRRGVRVEYMCLALLAELPSHGRRLQDLVVVDREVAVGIGYVTCRGGLAIRAIFGVGFAIVHCNHTRLAAVEVEQGAAGARKDVEAEADRSHMVPAREKDQNVQRGGEEVVGRSRRVLVLVEFGCSEAVSVNRMGHLLVAVVYHPLLLHRMLHLVHHQGFADVMPGYRRRRARRVLEREEFLRHSQCRVVLAVVWIDLVVQCQMPLALYLKRCRSVLVVILQAASMICPPLFDLLHLPM